MLAGILFLYKKNSPAQELSYFGSQTSFIFLILYRIIRDVYYPIFLREPEFSKKPKHRIDIIPTVIVFAGTIALPFVFDTYVTQVFLK
ncbi:hypothetical protein EV144_102732 [Flavobacterium sp. 270]|nr:hypothetical protein EV144_102732 [Flavobacterium sp. 270]